MFEAMQIGRALWRALDVVALLLSPMLACVLKYDLNVPEAATDSWPLLFCGVPAMQYVCMHAFGALKVSWVHFGMQDVKPILYALSAATCSMAAVQWVAAAVYGDFVPGSNAQVAPSLLMLDAGIAFVATVGLRIAKRAVDDACGRRARDVVRVDKRRPLSEACGETLLRRQVDRSGASSSLRAFMHGRRVLVTGAGGSIGSELCRQLANDRVASLFLVDRCENGLFQIHHELARTAPPNFKLEPIVACVTERLQMRALFERCRPDVVLHAAACKHVPMMEVNEYQAIVNNVIGTRVVADLASEFRVRKFVMVSTDKAVRPRSVMGATKRAAEIYIQSMATHSATRFFVVRFGNVLGSAGSVTQIFEQQVARGGPITITDPRMTRYLMTIEEACNLILVATRLGQGGETFFLDMGEPVRILDLAQDIIARNGLTPGVDIEIVFTGIRPGEKLSEELWLPSEAIAKTAHPSIFKGTSSPHALEAVRAWHGRLDELRAAASGAWVRPFLNELVLDAEFASEKSSVSGSAVARREGVAASAAAKASSL